MLFHCSAPVLNWRRWLNQDDLHVIALSVQHVSVFTYNISTAHNAIASVCPSVCYCSNSNKRTETVYARQLHKIIEHQKPVSRHREHDYFMTFMYSCIVEELTQIYDQPAIITHSNKIIIPPLPSTIIQLVNGPAGHM